MQCAVCPCSLAASAIVHAFVSLSELQGASLPANVLMKVPIDALNEGPKQQWGMCGFEEEHKMNEVCGDLCVPARQE